MSSAPVIEAPPDLASLPGLRDMWGTLSRREPSDRPLATRVLLDLLGIGLEPGIKYLGRESPDWETFLDWVVATAGPPDPDRLARFAAWHRGEAAPPTERARQAAVMAMPPVFDADEMAQWDRDGVIVLKSAITRTEAAAIAEHLWATVEGDVADPRTWYGPRTNGIMIQQFQHPAMDVPRQSKRIAKAFAQLYGHADLIVSTDRLSFNAPETGSYRFPGPHLHWDDSLTPPMPFETAGILYLTDTAADQGALQVVRGFHHRLAEGWLETLDGADPRLVDLSGEAETVPAGAGDMVIWRQQIPHGASANRSDRPRLAQYVNWYPMQFPDDRAWL